VNNCIHLARLVDAPTIQAPLTSTHKWEYQLKRDCEGRQPLTWGLGLCPNNFFKSGPQAHELRYEWMSERSARLDLLAC